MGGSKGPLGPIKALETKYMMSFDARGGNTHVRRRFVVLTADPKSTTARRSRPARSKRERGPRKSANSELCPRTGDILSCDDWLRKELAPPRRGAEWVEAPGIEPGSGNTPPQASTCLFRVLIYPSARPRTGSLSEEFDVYLATTPIKQNVAANPLVLCPKYPVGTDTQDSDELLFRQPSRILHRHWRMYFPAFLTR